DAPPDRRADLPLHTPPPDKPVVDGHGPTVLAFPENCSKHPSQNQSCALLLQYRAERFGTTESRTLRAGCPARARGTIDILPVRRRGNKREGDSGRSPVALSS